MKIMKTQARMINKLCCKNCGSEVVLCSSCGDEFGIYDNIGCSELPDGKHYCEDCTLKLLTRR